MFNDEIKSATLPKAEVKPWSSLKGSSVMLLNAEKFLNDTILWHYVMALRS
uniref:Uncharacterized protein n=1 Tax=Anguilla anguilla TaxID=7936 RepID=A0A0E9U7K2_ANGAN